MVKRLDLTKVLLEQLWSNNRSYYDEAQKTAARALKEKNGYLVKLQKYASFADNLLDCGCGSEAIIEGIWQDKKKYYGIDLSPLAIKLAGEKFRHRDNVFFSVGNLEKLEFKNNHFYLVYASAVLEHLARPEKVIQEMIRVTKKGGYLILILISPNSGSPFFPSECLSLSKWAYFRRLIKRILKSFYCCWQPPKDLDWARIYPKYLINKEYHSDWDAVNEPYLQTLIIYLKKYRLEPKEFFCSFQAALDNPVGEKKLIRRYSRKLFFLIEKLKISPFCYYGPSFFIAGQKC